MSGETVIFGMGEGPCLACDFTVEALADALAAGSFAFCATHLLRVSTYVSAVAGQRHLRAVEPRRPMPPPDSLRPSV